jgi:hypothetical protein
MVESGAVGKFRGMRIFLSTPCDYMTSKPDGPTNFLAACLAKPDPTWLT